jgi:hypothetical protein
MRVEDAFDFVDGIRVEEGFVAVTDDQFGFRAVEVTARIGNDAVVPTVRWAGILLADDVVKGNCGRNRCQGHERRSVDGHQACDAPVKIPRRLGVIRTRNPSGMRSLRERKGGCAT